MIGIMLLSHLRDPYGMELSFPTIAPDDRISLATPELSSYPHRCHALSKQGKRGFGLAITFSI